MSARTVIVTDKREYRGFNNVDRCYISMHNEVPGQTHGYDYPTEPDDQLIVSWSGLLANAPKVEIGDEVTVELP